MSKENRISFTGHSKDREDLEKSLLSEGKGMK
jgi:hypothetical protein